MKIVPYVHSPQEHEGFVFSSFCFQTCEPDSVLRNLIQDGARIVVAESSTGLRQNGTPICIAWAGTHLDKLIYCYIKHELRDFPAIPRLFEALGLDNDIPVLFMTRQLKAIGRHWNFNFKESV